MPRHGQAQISFWPPFTGMVKSLVLVTAAVFLVTYVPVQLMPTAFGFLNMPLGTQYFGLIPYDVTHHLVIWQLATYLFLHGGWGHIIFNCLALWMFGHELVRTWGSRRFLFYFFLTGVGAALFNVLLDPMGRVPVIGNSGAVYGVLLAYGVLFPD